MSPEDIKTLIYVWVAKEILVPTLKLLGGRFFERSAHTVDQFPLMQQQLNALVKGVEAINSKLELLDTHKMAIAMITKDMEAINRQLDWLMQHVRVPPTNPVVKAGAALQNVVNDDTPNS